jgi:serine/threonine protein phosphatase PrpC
VATVGTVQETRTTAPVILLTTDGIHDVLTDAETRHTIADITDHHTLPAVLVDTAIRKAERAGRSVDNTTALVMVCH